MKSHSAAKCQAKDPSTCPYHGSTTSAAVTRGDINAFIDAKIAEQPDLSSKELESMLMNKPSYPAGFKSKETVELEGKIYDAEDLYKSKKLESYSINKVLHRPIAGTVQAPTEDLKTSRLQAAIFAAEVSDTADEMRNKKFGRFTSKKTKEEYYTSQLSKMKKSLNLNRQYLHEVLKKENITIMTPEQAGDVYTVEAGGVKLYHENYIYENIEHEYASKVLENTTAAVKKFKETGEFDFNPRAGLSAYA
jgi:hypothetical protein